MCQASYESMPEVLRNLPLNQLRNDPLKQQQSLTSPALTLGVLTFEWKDDLLAVKTPDEHHYLSRTQTVELLSYLAEQREALLRKDGR